MAQFVNIATLIPAITIDQIATRELPIVPIVSSYRLVLEDYEEHLPTCPRIGAVVTLSGDLPHLDPLPASVWEHAYSTYYAQPNRTDLY